MKLFRPCLVVLLSGWFASLLSALPAAAQPARVIIIRHAEKPENDEVDPHLSPEGRARAERLVKWLTSGKVLGTNGAPVAFYAAAPSGGRRSLRPIETLEPTARALGRNVIASHRAADTAAMARHILTSPDVAGKTVVICWVHDFITDLPPAFGVTDKVGKWKNDDYESAYVITFPNGKPMLEKAKQKLKKN